MAEVEQFDINCLNLERNKGSTCLRPSTELSLPLCVKGTQVALAPEKGVNQTEEKLAGA